MTSLSPLDERLLRTAIALSAHARAAGNEPYGAVLAGSDGEVLLEGLNTQNTARDCTAHAELNLARAASARFDPRVLAACTVYASGEPCPMCAGALYWAGVGRIVFALSIASMTELAGAAVDELGARCADVLGTGTRRVEVLGPALEGEARRVFTHPIPGRSPPP